MKYILILALALTTLTTNAFAQDISSQSTKMSKSEYKDWTTLTCSGFKTWQDCRTEARAICPSGFNTADQLENILIQRREVSIACKS